MENEARQQTEAERRAAFEQIKREKAEAFREKNKTAEKGGVLFAGSSLMEMFPVEQFAAEDGLRAVNRGIGGYITDELLANLDVCILDLAPAVLFLNIGTNDLSMAERSIGDVMANYREILRRVREALPETRIVLMAYYPVNPDAAADFMKPVLKIRSNEKLREANRALRWPTTSAPPPRSRRRPTAPWRPWRRRPAPATSTSTPP